MVAFNIARDRRRHQGIDRLARGDRAADVGRRLAHHRQLDACGAACSRPAGRRGAAPARGAMTSVTSATSSRQSRQVCRPAYWSWPRIRYHSTSGSAARSSRTRVEREAVAAPAQLAAFEHEARFAGDREPDHRLAVGGRGEAARLLPRLPDRHPADLVELELLERDLRERDVRVVHRVEAAAEDADPPHAPGSVAQSRGRRKSLYRRASARARLRLPVVAPGGERRHRHQDALGPAARLQAEMRAAVPDQVELDIAAAPVGLERALRLAVRHRLAPLHDRQVGRQERIADRTRHRERGLDVGFADVVEEHAADAARLLAMLQEEVLVAPGLVARVALGAERREDIAVDDVEVARVLLEAVVRRQVHAAAEPDHRLGIARRRDRDHAHVHVHGRHVRVARMEDQRDAHRLERRLRQVGAVLRGRRRQRATAHVRERAAAALEQRAVLDQPGDAVALERAAGRTRPAIDDERVAALGLERGDDARLQAEQVVADAVDRHRRPGPVSA